MTEEQIKRKKLNEFTETDDAWVLDSDGVWTCDTEYNDRQEEWFVSEEGVTLASGCYEQSCDIIDKENPFLTMHALRACVEAFNREYEKARASK